MNVNMLYLNGVMQVLESRAKMNSELEALYSRQDQNDVANLYLAKAHCYQDAVEVVTSFMTMANALQEQHKELPF